MIYIGNLSLGYVKDSSRYDAVSIWVALGPCMACNDNTARYFTQAGYTIGFTDFNGISIFTIGAFLCAYKGSCTSVYSVKVPVASGIYVQGKITYLNVFLEHLNGKVLA
ncbi:hypothetical protein HS5_09510 [Acidianus sp. HS-5]|nr:hypothetical protein HS5_09510 [Acidianus sp. HS-5]